MKKIISCVVFSLFVSTSGFAQFSFWNIMVSRKCNIGFELYSGSCVKSAKIIVSSNSANLNIFSLAGSPTQKVAVTLTINSGVSVYSATTATPALATGSGWVSGSIIRIINNGNIYGMGGAGGNGSGAGNTYTAGSPGGTALLLNYPVTITNNGNIFGGGGGGAGAPLCTRSNVLACGGSGGGGQGWGTSAAGSLPACYAGANYPSGSSGGTGSLSSPGGAGSIGNSGTYNNQFSGGVCKSGTPGAGGAWGLNGEDSSPSSFQSGTGTTYSGVSGGAAGNAIKNNGNNITWISGNNTTQVKGPVN